MTGRPSLNRRPSTTLGGKAEPTLFFSVMYSRWSPLLRSIRALRDTAVPRTNGCFCSDVNSFFTATARARSKSFERVSSFST